MTCGGGSGALGTKNERTAVSGLIIPRGGTATKTSGPSAAGEPALPPSPVSARSAPPPACCISLVMGTALDGTNTQASDPGSNGRLSSPRGHDARRRRARPTRSMRNGYTGSVTPASPQPVQPDRRPLVSSFVVAPIAGAGAADDGVTPTAAGTPLPPPASVSVSASASANASTAGTTSLTVSAMYGSGNGPLPDDASLQSFLSVVTPHLRGDGLRVVPIPIDLPDQLHRKYELRISSSTLDDCLQVGQNMVVLVLAPSSRLGLLRSEKSSVEAEAAVLEWIRGKLLVKSSTQSQKGSWDDMEERSYCCTARNQQRSQVCDDALPEDEELLRYLPTVIEHSPSTQRFGSAYSILSYPRGLSSSSSTKCLSTAEARQIQYRSGRMARQVALLPSPSSSFGPALSVLSTKTAKSRRSSRGREQRGGMDSWSMAFHALLEGILRDAEDMAVTIPYQKIRWHYGRLRHYLDRVTLPRLVVLSPTHESHVIMESSRYETRLKPRTDTPSRQPYSHNSDDPFEGERERRRSDSQPSVVNMTGFRDWGNCIFGDPLMATVLQVVGEGSSRDFIRGFSGRQSAGEYGEVDENENDLLSTYGDIIECPEHAPMRLLLYQCYHELVAIVAEFYRPRKDSMAREFEARKRLNTVLAELDAMRDDPKGDHSQEIARDNT